MRMSRADWLRAALQFTIATAVRCRRRRRRFGRRFGPKLGRDVQGNEKLASIHTLTME